MKPGYLTTEFWLTVAVVALCNLGTLDVPEKYRWIVTLGGIVGYALSRGLAKYEENNVGAIFPPASDPVDGLADEFAEQDKRRPLLGDPPEQTQGREEPATLAAIRAARGAIENGGDRSKEAVLAMLDALAVSAGGQARGE